MKTRVEVTADKLRGGFYTPRPLVRACLDRARDLLRQQASDLRVLEPSSGDGAFLRELGDPEWRSRIRSVLAVELLQTEAEKSRATLTSSRLEGTVVSDSAIAWSSGSYEFFDLAVGNPPFVRYQFVSAEDRAAIEKLAARHGTHFAGVGNLWIAVLLAAVYRLTRGGVFSFVVPTECFTGSSASVVREWLINECDAVRVDLFVPGSFPGVLQEVAVLSGRRHRSPRMDGLALNLVQHSHNGAIRAWTHTACDAGAWTRFLLDSSHLDTLTAARRLTTVRELGAVAAFEVSIVTGANDFFSVDDATAQKFALSPWCRPLLPRIRHADGLRYTKLDHDATKRSGAKTWLLDFSGSAPDPQRHEGASSYLEAGEAQKLHERYKCRIREPWYRVPGIRTGELLLSKRSHHFPRVVVNDARVFTTDTIYRGRMLPASRCTAAAFAATFHNSLTLLTAELEGRSFGGGVLELVPSEIGRLAVCVASGAEALMSSLDAVSRSGNGDALIDETDAALAAHGVVPAELLSTLREAREILLTRRLLRSQRSSPAEHEVPSNLFGVAA